jgi:hypothetical protein
MHTPQNQNQRLQQLSNRNHSWLPLLPQQLGVPRS